MRHVMLTCGAVTLAAVWLGPLPQLARRAFWAHMTILVQGSAVEPREKA